MSDQTPQFARLSFHGGVGKVTGANFLFETLSVEETVSAAVLVDCGLIQGGGGLPEENYEPFAYDPASVDALFITHAHIDHIGRIPKLVREGFRGTIYSTPPTKDLAQVLFDDALPLMEQGAKKLEREPLYGQEDVIRTMKLWRTVPYHENIDLPGGVTARLRDAGHILGSAMVDITSHKKTITFTGDLGNSPSPLLPDTEPLTSSTYLLMESVYGDRNHEDRNGRREKLAKILKEGIDSGGTIVIPAFSLERTQELLFELNGMLEDGTLPSIPVFLDSPLAIRVTDIYKKHISYFNEHVNDLVRAGDDVFDFPKLTFTESAEESKEISGVPGPKIVIAGSGMSVGGRVLHHEKQYLSDPKNTILFVGYQGAETLGRRILEGAKSIVIFGTEVPVRARVREALGYSAHKDMDNLLDLVETGAETLEKVFVTMGEPRSSMFLAQRIRDYIDIPAVVPQKGESVTLEF